MSGTAGVGKEVRALLPTFAATLATMLLATQAIPYFRVRLLLLAVCLGSIALGALSIGQEYAHRTLTLLLAQPVSRGRLFAIKAAALLPIVVAVPVAAYVGLPADWQGQLFVSQGGGLRAILILAPLCAVCLAPALSMLCRSALAAIVFTLAIAGLVLLSGEVIGTAIHGFRNPSAVEAFKIALVWRSVALICAVSPAVTWLLFRRLQAVEGHAEVALPAWLQPARTDAVPPRRVPNVWAALVRKELHLQQLTFVVVALYLVAAAAIRALQLYAPEFPHVPIEALSVLYCGLLAVLIGAVASAEERQLGTLPAQMLQPVAAWQQWAIKAGTVLALALVLGIALPLLVSLLAGHSEGGVRLWGRGFRQPLVPLLFLTSASLYVSSVCSSGVRAIVTSIPVITAAAVYAFFVSDALMRAAVRAFPFDLRTIPRDEVLAYIRSFERVTEAGLIIGVLLFLAVVLSLASANHRRVDRSHRGIAVQAAIILAMITVTMAVPALAQIILRPGALHPVLQLLSIR